jgi:large subunit ribosomal protein L4
VATIKKYNLAGQLLEEVAIDAKMLTLEACPQMIKDYLVALRANARQWSASTKTRPEVSHSGQKPHPQKGTGKARQGYLGAPQYKGGGRVFAPRPKFDQFVHVNRKERRAAIQFLLSEKIKGSAVHILDAHGMKGPKTKKVAEFLKKLQIDGKRVLFVDHFSESKKLVSQDHFHKSMRNIAKAEYRPVHSINGYDLAVSQNIVVMVDAVDELKALLKARG